jgi:outer membrane protein insertion porin family
MGFLLLLLLISSTNSLPFTNIEIKGNTSFSQNQIIKLLPRIDSDNMDEGLIENYSRKILQFYKNQGFIESSIHLEATDKTLVIHICEGEKFTIGNINIRGNRFTKDDILLNNAPLKEGEVFNQEKFKSTIDDVLQFYGNSGFPFTRIIPSSFKTQKSRININLEIEEGPRLRWGKVKPQGNSTTKDFVVQKQMRIPEGNFFSEEVLNKSYRWLNRLKFLESAEDAKLIRGEKSGTVDVLVKVRELRANRINGIIGYMPSRNEEKGGYVGSITAQMLNLFGTGRAVDLHWEKQIPPFTNLHISYKEPWIFGTQTNLSLSLSHLIEDTLYSISEIYSEIETEISYNLALNLRTGWEKFSPAAIDIPKSNKYSIGSKVQFLNLDREINPSRGIHYIFNTEYGKKTDADVMKFSVSLLNIIPLITQNVFSLYITGKASRTNDPPLPYYEQFTLGGYKSLRGFRERQFRAIHLLRVSPEYRYLVSEKSRLYLFYDSAYFKTCTYPKGETDYLFKYGYGTGANFLTPIGIISIEYAIGEEKKFMKGKIHIGVDTTF